MDFVGLTVNLQRQELHKSNEVRFGPPSSHFHLTMTGFGFNRHKQVSRPGPLILVILLRKLPWRRRHRPAGLLQQLFTLLIQADHWFSGIVRLGVKPKQAVHPLTVFGRDPADAPHHLAPRFTDVFFRKRRMVSRLMFFRPLSLRAACASSRTVQRLAPSGGSLQAKATTLASCSVW